MRIPFKRNMNIIEDSEGTPVATILPTAVPGEGVRNGDAIVHACNSYHPLIYALEQAQAALPDAWSAVDCKVPVEVIDLVGNTLSEAKSVPISVEDGGPWGILAADSEDSIPAAERNAAIKALFSLLEACQGTSAGCSAAAAGAREVIKDLAPDLWLRLVSVEAVEKNG